MRFLVFLSAVLLAAPLRADITAFSDTYDFTTASGVLSTDLTTEAAARQAGGSRSATYTKTLISGTANEVYLESKSTAFGPSDVLLHRTTRTTSASQTATDLSADFGSDLAGKKWSATYRGTLARSSTEITDSWIALSIGTLAGVDGPNNANADVGLLVRGTGACQLWGDNAVLGTATINSAGIWGSLYIVTLTVDETIASPTVTVTVKIGTATTTLGPFAVAFPRTNRFLEVRAHQGGGTTAAGATMEARLDDLQITAVSTAVVAPTITAAPEGQTLFVGDAGQLKVTATGSGPLTYEWKLDNVVIAGATSATYQIPAAALNQGGTYRVTVSNSAGTATSTAQVAVVFPTRQQLTSEPAGPSTSRSPLAFTEIMYHPADRPDGKDLEFVEIYNSSPFTEEIGGWKLAGDIAFTFPAGTTVAGLSYLVVARVPADLQAVTGLAGVSGPFTGKLSNGSGTLQLRKRTGAVVLATSWADQAPWPVAADGAGPSLVLARPSLSEGSPRAWAASAAVGGSPGQADPVPSADLDHVVINEISTRGDAEHPNFIELANESPLTIDLAGCTLALDPAAAGFAIPAGTTLGPRGHIRFEESALGFVLPPQGGAVLFRNANGTRIVDAVEFHAQPAGRSEGRWPEGSGEFRLLQSATPAAANSAPFRSPVVINEVMYKPISGSSDDEFIELYNRSSQAVDIGGWRISGGIDYTIAPGQVIAAGGYLVIAKNVALMAVNYAGLAAVGPFSGSLANNGERLVLEGLEAGLTPTGYAVMDAVDYAGSTRTSHWADGGGSSLERIDPGADDSFSNWADSDESAKSQWVTIEQTGLLDLGNSSAPPSQVQLFLLDAGEALVDDVRVIPQGGSNLVSNSTFDSNISGWTPEGTMGNSGAASAALRLRASGRGDPSPNRVRAQLTSTPTTNTTATVGARARWLAGNADFLVRLSGNWLEAAGTLPVPKNLGTPGAVNSRAAANAGPAIAGVLHRPALPIAGLPFRVFAQVQDPNGVASVTLRYRIDPATTLQSVAMQDDGANGDFLAGDGVYTASVPAQTAGSLVAFRVEATDGAGTPATAIFPPSAPASECLARVGETLVPGAFGNYRIWMTQATFNTWVSRSYLSNHPLDVTFVYGSSRIIYGAGSNFAGGVDAFDTPTGLLCGYDVQLPGNETLVGSDHLTLDWPVRDVTNQREQLMHWMLEQMDLPNLYRRDIHLYVNGVHRGVIYHDTQQPGSDVLDEYWPDDSDGWLLKTAQWGEFSSTGAPLGSLVNNRLEKYLSGGVLKKARYRWNWRPRATGTRSQNDYTKLFELVETVNATTNYRAGVESLVDMQNWMRTFAFDDLCSYWDAFGNPNSKNTYLYKPTAARWTLISADLDVGLGVFGDPTNAALFPAGYDPTITTMVGTPGFIRHYWSAMRGAMDGFFKGGAVTPRLQQRYDAYLAQGVTVTSPFVASGAYSLSIPAWIDQRAAFLETKVGAFPATFTVTGPTAFSVTDSPTTVSGTAPLTVATITANGTPLEVTWTSETQWSAPVYLQGGANAVAIQGINAQGGIVGTVNLTITFTGANAWPALKINEWMASNTGVIRDPADNKADDWLEIYNPTASAVNLDGWRLTDDLTNPTKYTIPAGYVIPAGGRLLVWADSEAAQNLPSRPDLHVSFALSKGGEAIGIYAPDGTLIDSVTFGQQYDNISQGRLTDGGAAIGFLGSPSPKASNGGAPTAAGIGVVAGNGTATVTLQVLAGYSYQIQYKNDLADAGWTNLGTATVAAGPTVIVNDALGTREQRFYRAVRTP